MVMPGRFAIMRVWLGSLRCLPIGDAKRHGNRVHILQRKACNQDEYGKFSEKIEHAGSNANAKMIPVATSLADLLPGTKVPFQSQKKPFPQ